MHEWNVTEVRIESARARALVYDSMCSCWTFSVGF